MIAPALEGTRVCAQATPQSVHFVPALKVSNWIWHCVVRSLSPSHVHTNPTLLDPHTPASAKSSSHGDIPMAQSSIDVEQAGPKLVRRELCQLLRLAVPAIVTSCSTMAMTATDQARSCPRPYLCLNTYTRSTYTCRCVLLARGEDQ